jgi:hypothetical protein
MERWFTLGEAAFTYDFMRMTVSQTRMTKSLPGTRFTHGMNEGVLSTSPQSHRPQVLQPSM